MLPGIKPTTCPGITWFFIWHVVFKLEYFLLFQDTKLLVIGRQIPKSWTVPAPIRYVKVTTLYFEEVLLLGLMNGQVKWHWQHNITLLLTNNNDYKKLYEKQVKVKSLFVSLYSAAVQNVQGQVKGKPFMYTHS